MKNHLSLIVLTVLVAVSNGCQTAASLPPQVAAAPTAARNNCYSLLHQLLDQQKDVSLLRFIKREDPDVKNLIKKIAAVSGDGAKLVERYAHEDRSIVLEDVGLPPGEVLTREAIGTTKKKELLGNSGGKFELALLLTQAEALNYGWHLAHVTAQHEAQPERVRALNALSQEMENLYHEVVARLQLRAGTASK